MPTISDCVTESNVVTCTRNESTKWVCMGVRKCSLDLRTFDIIWLSENPI